MSVANEGGGGGGGRADVFRQTKRIGTKDITLYNYISMNDLRTS